MAANAEAGTCSRSRAGKAAGVVGAVVLSVPLPALPARADTAIGNDVDGDGTPTSSWVR